MILVYSFGSENLISFNVDFGWTTANYRAFGSSLYLDTLLRSVTLSLGTTLACAILGLTLAYFISRQGPRTQRLLLAAVIIPFWTSFIVRTYSWVDVLQNDGPLDNLAHTLGFIGPQSHINLLYTPTSIGIGIVYSYLPLMILPIYVSLERIDPAIYNAGADLGATPWRQFRRIVLPLGSPGADCRKHHRRRPGHGRVRDPGDPGRRQDADGRQHHRQPVPGDRQLSVRRGSVGHPDGAPDCWSCSSCVAFSFPGSRRREHPSPPDQRRC